MKIECPECNAVYNVDRSKIPDKGVNIRCKKCQSGFFISKETPEQVPEQEPVPKQAEARDQEETPVKEPPPEEASSEEEEKGEPADADDPEQQAVKLAENGDEEEAAKLMLELIEKYCDSNSFAKAETLLEKMYDVTPMALNDIVKAGELIEEKKNLSIDQDHMNLWEGLYASFQEDESSEFYYSLVKLMVKEGDTVYKQGQLDSNLYFVQEGNLKLVYYNLRDESDTDLKELSAGDISNFDPFFSFSACGASLVAASESNVLILEKKKLEKWKEKFPGIENKLNKFCKEQDSVKTLIENAGPDLRLYERVNTSIPAMIQLMDNSNQPLQTPYKITIADISGGGIGYMTKLHRPKDAQELLGHQLILQFIIPVKDEKKKISKKGTVVGVHLQAFGDSSVHIKFQTPFDDKVIEYIGSLDQKEE